MTLAQLYLNPIVALAEGWRAKAALSAAFVLVTQTLGDLFATRLEFAALVIVLVMLDLATGLLAAFRRGERLQSRKMRQTVVKSIEYAAFLSAAVAFTNVLGVRGTLPLVAPVLANLAEVAFVWTATTEITSILENLSPGGGPRRAMQGATNWLKGKLPTDMDHDE